MRRRPSPGADAPGQDSFLDIVANLVGILIILVMIVGARAKDAIVRGQHADPPAAVPAAQVQRARQDYAATQVRVEALAENVEQQQLEVAYRRAERDRMLSLLKTAEVGLSQQEQQLGKQAQQAHQLHTQVLLAAQELEDLRLSQAAVQQTKRPVLVLEHRPTPLAQTVFGKEVHFRLTSGRIAYVPLEELVHEYQQDARQHVQKLRQTPTLTETVGPIGGFRLQYTLKRVSYSLETRAGAMAQDRVELDHFVLVPVQDDLGEDLPTALGPGSQFRSILQSYDPQQVTVTVWVYPDGFAEFRQLKDALRELGFLIAGRPLPAGQPISGSPDGSQSAAQ